MKYKLVKTYPGSPELGIEVEKESSSKSSSSYFYRSGDKRICVFNDHVEDNPEYWEKVNDNLWWVVFKKNHVQDGTEYFSSWTAHLIETCLYQSNDSRHYFKTKEEAQEFIFNNKPCLSFNDLNEIYSNEFLMREGIVELIKSKL